DRHFAAYYLWEAALKLLGSVCVAEYARLEEHDPQLRECLQNLARPSVGHWWEFVRRLVPALTNRSVVGFEPLNTLLLGRARDDLLRAAGLQAMLSEVLDGKRSGRATCAPKELFDSLVRYRNSAIGHGAAGQKPADEYDRMGRAM